MRYSVPWLICIISLVSAGEIVTDFSLDPDSFESGTFEGRDFIQLDGGSVATPEGTPFLPGLSYTFVIPQGNTVNRIEVDVLETQELDGRFDLLPVRYIPLSIGSSVPVVETPGVYCSDDPFPTSPVVSLKNGNRTGFRISSFSFVPFVYHPLSGRLTVITEARLTLHYDHDSAVRTLALSSRQIAMASAGLESIVANPSMLLNWAPEVDSGTDGPAWVVIADQSLQSFLAPLVAHREAATGPSSFVSLDWIYSNYTGNDTQEQIRNYLKDAFANDGLVYALIVGNFGETTRISYLQAGSSTLLSTVDLYYSDLDYNWDGNYNGQYGEIDDGIDYYSDIYVGRFSSDLSGDIEVMVEKTITYETGAPLGDWRTTALFAGAGLWPDVGYWGSFVCDSLAKRLPSGWTVHKLYENESGHPNNQIELINEGVSYMTPQGHGSQAGVYWYYGPLNDIITNGNYQDMTNGDMLPVFHSMACLSGRIQSSCIAENLMNHPDGGAAAVMFNSNYGWGSPPSMGPSEELEIFFADMLFTYNRNEIGVANALAKDELTVIATSAYDFWVIQENNLLGDPALLFAAGQNGVESTTPRLSGVHSIAPPAPNPFSSSCMIPYSTTGGNATISVFDLSGRLVKRLHSGFLPEGEGSIGFDGTDDSGVDLPTGCYTVVLSTDSGCASARVVLIR